MSRGLRASGVLRLAELAGVTTWSPRLSGRCVGCWEEQRTATLTGARASQVPPRGAGRDGEAVGLCGRHRAELLAHQGTGGCRGDGRVCGGGRCRVDGAVVALCERHHAALVTGGAR